MRRFALLSRAVPFSSEADPAGRRRAASLLRVEPGIDLSGLLLQFERLGSMIPKIDLLCQSVLDRRACLSDPINAPLAYFLEMLRNNVRDGMGLSLLLQVFRDPRSIQLY